MSQLLVVGTYGEKLGHVHGKAKGLYVLSFDRDSLSFQHVEHGDQPQLGETFINPTFLTHHRDASSGRLDIYVVDESHSAAGTVAALTIDEATGKLCLNGVKVPAQLGTGPAACCHVSVSPGGKHVLAANYLGGSICAIGRRADGTLDHNAVQYLELPPPEHPIAFPRANAARQESAHAHMALCSVGTQSATVLVPDLGSDTIWSIPYDASRTAAPLGTPVPATPHPALEGAGPRHAALHPTAPVCFVGYELTSVVAAFRLDAATGAIVGAPLGVRCVLDGVPSGFAASTPHQGSADAVTPFAALVQPNWSAPADGSDLPPGHGAFKCSDQATSVAAIAVAPDAAHLVVSSRIVGAPGALSAIPLRPNGLFANAVEEHPIRITSTAGRTPRDFVLLPALPSPPEPERGESGKRARAEEERPPQMGLLALVANQDDDKIVALCEGEQPRELTMAVPTPVCMCLLPPPPA